VKELMKQSADKAIPDGSVRASDKKRRARRRLILTIFLVAAAIIVWEEVLKYHVIPKRWGSVEAGHIYRSGRLSTTLVKPMLQKYGIDVIVDLTSDIPTDKEHIAQKAAAEELGIRVARFPLGGSGTGNIICYAGAIATIVDALQNNQTVLVHCEAGSQRTGGVIACYRLLVQQRTTEDVYQELQDYGWQPDDYKLVDYLNTNMAILADMLQKMGVIEEIPSPLPLLPDTYGAQPSPRPVASLAR